MSQAEERRKILLEDEMTIEKRNFSNKLQILDHFKLHVNLHLIVCV